MEEKDLKVIDKKSKVGLVIFIILLVLLTIIKQALVADLPAYMLVHAKQDDALMVDMAINILNGNWLGEYSELIFTKGVMFPLFLCLGHVLGISYISFQTIVYTLSCMYFIYSIKDFIKSKWILLGIFICLIFNPVSFANNTLLRVYRNGITMSQVLLILGSYIGMYMNRTNKKKVAFFSIFACIGFCTMYHTREDAFWILPFMLVVTIILIALLIKDKKKEILKTGKMLLVLYVLPFIMLTVVTNIISTINYYNYGIYTYNELNDSNFTACMKAIYSVKPNVEIEYVSNPKEKMERIAEVSPTFNEITDVLFNDNYIYYDSYDRKKGDGEVEDGWYFWLIRESVIETEGYDTAEKINEFYAKVTEEINQAIKQGKLEKQMTMPSSLMPPWRKGNLGKLFSAFGEEIGFILNYDSVEISMEKSVVDSKYIAFENFKNITKNFAYLPEIEVQISGWYANIYTEDVNLEVQDEEHNVLYVFSDLKEDTILRDYINNRFNINHSGKVNYYARFNVSRDIDKLYLVVKTNGEEILRQEVLKDATTNLEDENGSLLELKKVVYTDVSKENTAQKSISSLNKILDIYRSTGVAVFVIGFIIFVLFIIRLIYVLVKGKINENIDSLNTVLILLGILLTVIVLMFGVAYNHIASCDSITYMYLSGAYPIVIMFWSVSIGKCLENIICFIKGKIRNNG